MSEWIRIEGKIVWQFALDPRNDRWYAICPRLKAAVNANTYRELVDAALDRMARDMMADKQDNRLPGYLQLYGLTASTPPQDIASSTPHSRAKFDIPLEWTRVTVQDLAMVAPDTDSLYNIFELFPKT